MIFGGSRQVVRTTSSPDGALVVTNPMTSEYKTPTSLSLERKNNYTLTFSYPGYSTVNFELQKEMRVGIVVADVLLTGLIGVIVDAATGSWYKLSPETAHVTLTKVNASVPGPDQIHVGVSLDQPNRASKGEVKITTDGPTVNVDVQPR